MMKMIMANLCSLVCFGTAGVLAFYGKEGWGWFLVVGFCVCHVWRSDNDDE